MNVVLVGYRCSGKTTVGKSLAGELGRVFLDTDSLIEETAGCSIETLVAEKGWDHFRNMETGLLSDLSNRENLVIATGGGIVTNRENSMNIKRNSWVVWLDVRPDIIRKRMVEDQNSGITRPSLTGAGSLEEIADVLRVRERLYQTVADHTVDAGTLSVREITALIVRNLPQGFWREQSCPEIHSENCLP